MNITAPVSHVRSASAGLPAVGRSVLVTVLPGPRSGSVVLKGPGLHVEISTPKGLVVGNSYVLRAVSQPSGTVLEFTHHIPPTTPPSPGLTVASNFVTDPLTTNLLYSIFASQRERRRETVASVLSFFDNPRPYRRRKASSISPREVRRALELADRGIPPELTFLSSVVGGIPFSEPRQEQKEGEKGAEQNEYNTLSQYLRRTTPRGSHELHVYNHTLPSGGIHWVTIPLGAQRNDETGPYVGGVYRIGLRGKTNTPERAVLSIALEDATIWWFNWKLPGPKLESWYSEGPTTIPSQLIAILGGEMRNGDESADTFKDGFPDVDISLLEGIGDG